MEEARQAGRWKRIELMGREVQFARPVTESGMRGKRFINRSSRRRRLEFRRAIQVFCTKCVIIDGELKYLAKEGTRRREGQEKMARNLIR